MNEIRWKSFVRSHLILAASAGAAVFGLALLPGGGVPLAAAQSGEEGAESLTREIDTHLERAQGYLDALLGVTGERTIENTLLVLNNLGIEIDAAASKASLMENVHPDETVRTAAETGSQNIQAFTTALSLNRDVYEAVTAVDVSGADDLTRRFKELTLRDYRRSGVDKDQETRDRIEALQKELVEIGQEFSRNIRDDERTVQFDPAALEGLPKDYIDGHPVDESGKASITTAYPDYLPVIKYARSTATRERMYHAFNNRGYPANKEVFTRLLEKRYELARLLGYDNWAHFITDDKMVGSPEEAARFIEKLDGAARERAERDVESLLARKRQDDPAATRVEDYEKSYLSELVRAEQYDFDSQALRPYFNYDDVRNGILSLTSTLFSVRYEPVTDAPVWHETVECYDIFEGDTHLGRFYLDMHPREGKYGHAAQFNINSGVKDRQVPVAALVCNFPGGDDSGVALMEHSDVETYLHEFGHLLHTIFGGNQEWIRFSGVATEWDFVEAPSQMLEEWSIDWSTLATFARHYETGEPIPAALVERLRAAQDFGKGIYIRQQNFYSAVSLHAYNQQPSRVSMEKMVPELQTKYSSFPYVPGTQMYASFGHLEGYSAMYYTYMWSLVIAKDLFSRFDTANMLDPKVATEYRRTVLDPGGTQDAADLVEEFLGRPYGFDSFRDWLNGAEAATP